MHKLLLADDSVTIQRVIELTFSGEDVQVVAVNDGEQAIARIPIEQPDVVLADIGMPRKGGYDVAAFVKGRPDLAHIPVLLLAGAFEPVDQSRAEQVRADGVLIKPFEPRQVVERVKELLAARPPAPVIVATPEPVLVPVAAVPAEPPLPPSVVEPQAPTPELATATPRADVDPSAQSLDELFETLNQAIAAPPKATYRPADAEDHLALALPDAAADLDPAPTRRDAETPESDVESLSFEPFEVTAPSSASLDDYFDRLSSAFAQIAPRAVEAPEIASTLASSGLPAEAPSAARRPAPPPYEWLDLAPPVPASHQEAGDGNPILAAIRTLTAENGHPPAPGARHGLAPDAPAPPAPRTEREEPSRAMVDEVTERVLARLAPAVAESLRRLTEQEIARRFGPR
jgi:CheY-like chemotaxis protein